MDRRLAAALPAVLAGCLDRAADCPALDLGAGDTAACVTPGWLDRAFDLHVPPGWDGAAPLPAILLFHGGGANRVSSDRTTCPGGDVASPRCFVAQAGARGYAVIVPDGTGNRPLRGVRTWNAGGAPGWECVSGGACQAGIDDIGYVGDVLAEVGRALPLDPRRRYATGISNGGALAHRLGCELAPPLAAIAPVGGANQFADTGGGCPGALPVLQLHGTADPCWQFEGGTRTCIGPDAPKTSVAATLDGWRIRNGCDATFVDTPVADVDPTDGVTVVHRAWAGCDHATELYRLDGGGHTWPGGDQYLGADEVGPVGRDLDSAAILDFFDAR
jgi:polyhydroxybutyrate depolymerase